MVYGINFSWLGLGLGLGLELGPLYVFYEKSHSFTSFPLSNLTACSKYNMSHRRKKWLKKSTLQFEATVSVILKLEILTLNLKAAIRRLFGRITALESKM